MNKRTDGQIDGRADRLKTLCLLLCQWPYEGIETKEETNEHENMRKNTCSREIWEDHPEEYRSLKVKVTWIGMSPLSKHPKAG